MLAAAAAQVLAVVWSPLQSLLGTEAPGGREALLLLGLSALPGPRGRRFAEVEPAGTFVLAPAGARHFTGAGRGVTIGAEAVSPPPRP